MNGFLIDTNILSEYNRPGGPNAGVKAWLETTERQSQFVSVITIAEIAKGIGLLAQGKRRQDLQLWLEHDLESWFEDRILPIDRKVANEWAELMIKCVRMGKPLPAIDSLIAATAIAHGLAVVTRNTRDFASAGATTVNPWQ